MEKQSVSFFIMDFVLLFAVIGFILTVFNLQDFAFVFELGILIIFIFFLAFAMFAIYHNKKWGWIISGAILFLLLVNSLSIAVFSNKFRISEIITMLFSVVGLVVVLVNFRTSAQDSDESEEDTKKEIEIEKTFTPGKYIASKKANKFHLTKCDWALRISKVNRIWFNSKEEAEAKGFQADKCVG